MVVKEKIGRKRYILFISSAKIKARVKIVYRQGNFGIARCNHREVDKVRKILENEGAETIKTSGTIKKLKEHINMFLQVAES